MLSFLFVLAASAAVQCASCGKHNTSTYLSYQLSYATRVSTFTGTPAHPSLFGAIAVTPAPIAPLYQHPRVLQSATEWNALLSRYANITNFDTPGSWAHYHRVFTVPHGPESDIIGLLSEMESNGDTAVYTGGTDMLSLTSSQRTALEPLVNVTLRMDELRSTSLFMCALWTGVQEVLLAEGRSAFLTISTDDCVLAAVAWAKVLLAHRAYHCAGACVGAVAGNRAYVWDYSRRFEVRNDWHTGGAGLALCYDVLYHRMSNAQKQVIRSALSMLVLKKASWGNTVISNRGSPNAEQHPHRIFSNWALYHSNLYITNLAIEGETGASDFDDYVQAVLTAEGEIGFNTGLNTRFETLIEAYMIHSIYPDGSTFEDGYTYFIALREGSLGVLAAHRRGVNVFDTNRFRNLIHNVAQMLEPWHCGQIIGHASGGGILYPTWAGLFRYVYPNGALPTMLWRQRMGDTFRNANPCRISWFQNMMQLSILGAEHGSSTTAESPAGLEPSFSQHFPLSYYTPRRGLLVARAGLGEDKAYMHFDARPDAFLPGHDNADRGVFTFSALRRTWFDDYEWRPNLDSRKHSVMHVDGLAQDEKAPSVSMVRTTDDGAVVLAVADLTYAYNVQWARNWPARNAPIRGVVTYLSNGTETRVPTLFDEKEFGHPQDFGWPLDDDGSDLGFTRARFNMHGDPDVGFLGMWTWKRAYRETPLTHCVRSIALVRQDGTPGYGLIVDALGGSGTHVFESYLMLRDGVSVDSGTCVGRECTIVLSDGAAQLDVHVVARGLLTYRTERFSSDATHTRLIVQSSGVGEEVMYVGLHAHEMQPDRFEMSSDGEDVRIVYGEDERVFGVDDTWGLVEKDSTAASLLPEDDSPMAAEALVFKATNKLLVADLESDVEKFYVDNGADFQKVWTIVSKSSERELDQLRTCARFTNARTKFMVVSCADEAQYQARSCTIVVEGGGECQSFKTDLRQHLMRGETYHVVLSVWQKSTSLQVFIRHDTKPVG